MGRRKSKTKATPKDRPKAVERGAGPVGRREWLILGCILLVGLLLRAAYLAEISGAPGFDAPGVDPGFHDYWARGMAFGEWDRPRNLPNPLIRSTPYIRPPGYPYFLAAIYRVFGPGYVWPRVMQMLLGLANVVLAFVFARRWYGSAVGLVLAALMACYWIFIFYEGQFSEPVLLVFLLLAFVNVAGLWYGRWTVRHALAAGLLLGLAALTRPNALALVPVSMVWAVWAARGQCQRRRLGAAALVFLLGVVVPIVPVTVRNYAASGEFVPISSNLGINLLIGNHKNATGKFVRHIEGFGEFGTCYAYPELVARLGARLGRNLSYSEASSYLAGQAARFMRDRPGVVAGLMFKKALLFWGPHEISHNKEVQCEREVSHVLRYVPTNFALAAGLFVMGLAVWIGQRRFQKEQPPQAGPSVAGQSRITILVLLIIAVYFLSYLPFFVTALYRVPIIPFMLLFAAYGLVHVWRKAAAREYRAAALWSLAGLVLFGLFSLPLTAYEPDWAKWHFSRGSAYTRKGQDEQAVPEYEEAVRINPGFFEARFTLGWTLLEMGRDAEGIAQLEECLKLRPDSLEAHTRLANAYMRERKVAQALPHYTAALELDPNNAVVRTNYGVALLNVGQAERAAEQFAEALRIDPNDATAHASLGTYSLERGRVQTAIEHFREAVRLDPKWAEVRFRLGQALERAGRLEEAAAEYREVLRADPGHALARQRLDSLTRPQSQ
jgi:tetratricopeptide (TPR) repeat protein